jgi:hypothetical protein
MDNRMTVKELEEQLERLAVADLDAGQLDAAVMKLGQLAALELMAEDAAREPGKAAPDGVTPELNEVWSDVLERAREQAQADLKDAPARVEPDLEEEPGRRVAVLLPLAGLGVLIVALLLIFGAGRAFESSAAAAREAQRAQLATAAAATPEPVPTSTRVPRPTAVPRAAAGAADDTADGAGEEAPCVDDNGAPLPPRSWLCRGRAIRGSAGTGGLRSATSDDAGSTAPPYEVVNSMRLGMPKRVRYEVNVVVPPSYSREEIVAVLTDAVRKTLRQKADARAVGVFAYSSRAGLGAGWDRGRALASVDGQGWTGDRTFAPVAPGTRDQGRIYLTLGNAIANGEAIEVDR